MVINQLFITKPSIEFTLKLLKCLGLKDFKDTHEFNILDMNKLDSVSSMKNLEKDIKKYYLPCKQKIYLSKWTNKNCITICRQFIRIYDFDIISREKFIKNKKYLLYRLITKNDKDILKKKKNTKKKEVIITFD